MPVRRPREAAYRSLSAQAARHEVAVVAAAAARAARDPAVKPPTMVRQVVLVLQALPAAPAARALRVRTARFQSRGSTLSLLPSLVMPPTRLQRHRQLSTAISLPPAVQMRPCRDSLPVPTLRFPQASLPPHSAARSALAHLANLSAIAILPETRRTTLEHTPPIQREPDWAVS